MIFSTNTIVEEGIGVTLNIDDIVETNNHFILFGYLLDNCDTQFSIQLINSMHKLIKSGTSETKKEWFQIGEWKQLPNIIGIDTRTTPPKQVDIEMLNFYRTIKQYQIFASKISLDFMFVLKGFILFKIAMEELVERLYLKNV